MQLSTRTISANSKILERRLLPTMGEVVVQRGQAVQAPQTVARAEVPHRYHVINIAQQLGQPDVDMAEVMQKEEGEAVEASEVIALRSARLAFLQRSVRTPVAGHIAKIGPGWVLLETERSLTEVQAFVNGVVTHIIPQRGVVIEASGAVIEAVCGFGGETHGRLNRLVTSADAYLDTEALTEELGGEIVVAGRAVDEEILRRAADLQIGGLIVGSIDAALLTLDPLPELVVVATEGFGDVPISPHAFGHLTALSGRAVSIRGQMPTLPPESESGRPLIFATSKLESGSEADPGQQNEAQVGSRVRVTRGQHLGAVGQINAIPPEPETTEIGLRAAGAYVTLDDTTLYVPWPNLELVR